MITKKSRNFPLSRKIISKETKSAKQILIGYGAQLRVIAGVFFNDRKRLTRTLTLFLF